MAPIIAVEKRRGRGRSFSAALHVREHWRIRRRRREEKRVRHVQDISIPRDVGRKKGSCRNCPSSSGETEALPKEGSARESAQEQGPGEEGAKEPLPAVGGSKMKNGIEGKAGGQ